MAWKRKWERIVCKSYPKALLVAIGAGNNQILPLRRAPEQMTAFSRSHSNKKPSIELLNLLSAHVTDSQHLFPLVLLPTFFTFSRCWNLLVAGQLVPMYFSPLLYS